MASTTRRALLAAAPLAVALPAVASATTHPDAELLTLGHQHAAACAENRRLDALSDAAERRYRAALPSVPEAMRWRSSDERLFGFAPLRADLDHPCPGDLHRLKAFADGDPVMPLLARRKARATEILSAAAPYEAAAAEARAASGCDDAEEVCSRHDVEVVWPIQKQISELPASTVEGLRIKAEAIRWNVVEPDENSDWADHAVWSLLTDLAPEGGR